MKNETKKKRTSAKEIINYFLVNAPVGDTAIEDTASALGEGVRRTRSIINKYCLVDNEINSLVESDLISEDQARSWTNELLQSEKDCKNPEKYLLQKLIDEVDIATIQHADEKYIDELKEKVAEVSDTFGLTESSNEQIEQIKFDDPSSECNKEEDFEPVRGTDDNITPVSPIRVDDDIVDVGDNSKIADSTDIHQQYINIDNIFNPIDAAMELIPNRPIDLGVLLRCNTDTARAINLAVAYYTWPGAVFDMLYRPLYPDIESLIELLKNIGIRINYGLDYDSINAINNSNKIRY